MSSTPLASHQRCDIQLRSRAVHLILDLTQSDCVSVARMKRVPDAHATGELEVRTSIKDSSGNRGSVAWNATAVDGS